MYLFVASTHDSGWKKILPLFHRTGFSIAKEQVTDLFNLINSSGFASDNKQLDELHDEITSTCKNNALIPIHHEINIDFISNYFEKFDDSSLLLFYSMPEKLLVNAMEEKKKLSDVLHEWKYSAEQLIKARRYSRQQSCMFDVDSVIEANEQFQRDINERFNLGIKVENIDLVSQYQESGNYYLPLYQLIAARLVEQTTELNEILGELEASSVPMQKKTASGAIDCERAYKKLQKMIDSIDKARELQAKYNNEEHENRLLMDQLHHVQEELESYYLSSKECEDKLNTVSRELRFMKNSKSWKITHPMRLVIKKIRGGHK